MTIIREERIGGQRLILGDCLEVMPLLGRVQHVITDPPYSQTTHNGARTRRLDDTGGDKLVTFEALSSVLFDQVVAACLSVADAWVVMTCDYAHAAQIYRHPAFVRLGAWVKSNPTPQLSGDRPGQGFETVAILHSGKTRKAWNRGGAAALWTYATHCGGLVPSQKPIGLVMAFVKDFTQPSATVLDPFMGSGTTLVACERQGRAGIGIESSPEHFDIACRRVDEATRQPDMFVAPTQAPAIQEVLL